MSHPNDNPWQDERGQQGYQGQNYPNQNSHPSYQDQGPGHGNPYTQQPHQGDYAAPDHPPPGQQRYYGSGATAPGVNEALHSNPTNPQQSNYASNPNPSGNPWGTHEDTPPSLPPRRTATDLALPQGQDRSHQIEVMQSYEAAGRKDEDDQNVEVLQREFPNIDGSLIAAIYGDSKSLSATREMLGELER